MDAGVEGIGEETAQMEIQAPLERQIISLDQDKYDFHFQLDQFSEYETNTRINEKTI